MYYYVWDALMISWVFGGGWPGFGFVDGCLSACSCVGDGLGDSDWGGGGALRCGEMRVWQEGEGGDGRDAVRGLWRSVSFRVGGVCYVVLLCRGRFDDECLWFSSYQFKLIANRVLHSDLSSRCGVEVRLIDVVLESRSLGYDFWTAGVGDVWLG
ncbi:hypothetical protein Tco_0874993 [Tanacetum coccineum]|uniref:Uncharacterized protein n=1 Tax=Tanacetum coccineum TaxID=301880 RepID=A0ABQ5BR88_9ASTR